jgi:hypothetical protein
MSCEPSVCCSAADARDERAMAESNRDPEVGRCLNRPVDEMAVAAFVGAMVEHWERHGFGPWALKVDVWRLVSDVDVVRASLP